MSEGKARLLMIISMVTFGTIGIFVKQVDLPPQKIVFYRVAFGLIAIMIFFAITRRRPDLSFLGIDRVNGATSERRPQINYKKNMVLIIASGVGLAGGWLFLFTSYNFTTVAIGTLVNYIEPCLVMIASVILFKEIVSKLRVLCFALSTAGLILVILGGGTGGGSPNLMLGVFSGLASAVFYATTVITVKRITGAKGFDITVCQLFVSLIVLLIYNLFTCGISLAGVPLKQVLCLIIIGMVHTGIIYSTYTIALQRVKAQEIAILAYLDPFVSVLSSAFVLAEPINGIEWLGAAMVIGFMILGEIKGDVREIGEMPAQDRARRRASK